MTVMVTGASGPVGHALVPLLARKDEVRVAVRDAAAADALRALGAKVTIGRLDDEDALADVLGGVFTLVHLVGGADHPTVDAVLDANHGSAVRAVRAAKAAGVRRLVFVSVPGASTVASVPFLRAKGLAEEAIATSGLQHAVIRSAPVVGAGSFWFAATVAGALESPPVVWGLGDRSIAPVAVGDLAAALAAADDVDGELEGVWGLEGPDAVSADWLSAMLTGEGAAPEHLERDAGRARLSSLLGRDVSPHAMDALTGPARIDAPDAAEAFGIERTALVAAIRAALAPAPVVAGASAPHDAG